MASMNSLPSISQSEQEYIRSGCAADCRSDGRTINEFRNYDIVTGPIQLSHGSARLTSCDNQLQILCSVKAELVTPSIHHPTSGSVIVAVDQHGNNNSNNSYLREYQGALQNRVAWITDTTTTKDRNAINSSGRGDNETTTSIVHPLCVVPGFVVWRLYVDVFVVSANGGWLDAASHCIRHALANTVVPAMEELAPNDGDDNATPSSQTHNILDRLIVNSDIAQARPLVSLHSIPFLITATIVPTNRNSDDGGGGDDITSSSISFVLVLDATPEEQAVSIASVHVAVLPSNHVVTAVWKSGKGSIPIHLLPLTIQTTLDASAVAIQSYRLHLPIEKEEVNSLLLLQKSLIIR